MRLPATALMLGRMNPRRHLTAAVGWAVFVVVILAALLTAQWLAWLTEQRVRAEAQGMLDELATQSRDWVSVSVETRRSLLVAVGASMVALPDVERRRQQLNAVRQTFPEFSALALLGVDGQVQVQDGDTAAIQGWQAQRVGSGASGISGLRASVSDARALPADGQHAADARVIDIVVALGPGQDAAGPVWLLGSLSWTWVERLLARLPAALDPDGPLELWLLARDGRQLAGPAARLGQRLDAGRDLEDGGRYLSGRRTNLRLADSLGLGWTLVVRQRADLALLPARSTRWTVFVSVFAAGVLSAAVAALCTQWLMRRLAVLADQAEAVRTGRQVAMAPPRGSDEVARIGAALAHTVDQLQDEKRALTRLNAELDARVAERTERINHMADEARHAAVNRERLRIARDLHDTLAHSLMAVLTQVRLVRKLGPRLPSTDLDAELQRAEAVAASGLAEARAAIGQMRGSGVRETGLGPALEDLTRRMQQRGALSVTLAVDDTAGAWADDRALVVYRIAEEALRNVERHARTRQAWVDLQQQHGQVVLTVRDEGVGFDPGQQQPGHFGLLGMREQAALIKATLVVDSAPDAGTRVHLHCAA